MAGDASEAAVRRQLRAAVDVVVQIERDAGGRRIDAIAGRDELEEAGT
jgi:Flp pilus assembly CpaF family ATPase